MSGGTMPIVVAGENRLAKDSLVDKISQNFGRNTLTSDSLDDVFNLVESIEHDLLVLLDYEMGVSADALNALRGRLSQPPRVAVYGAPADPDEAMRWLCDGYDGYLPRNMSASAISCAVELILRGEKFVPSITILSGYRGVADSRSALPTLSPRQSEILGMVATGQSNKHIARALGLEEVTVKSHVKSIFRKLGVHSRTEAARFVLAGPERRRRPEAVL